MTFDKIYAYIIENQKEVDDPAGFVIEKIDDCRLFIRIRGYYDEDQIYNAIAKIYPDHYQFIKLATNDWDTWEMNVPHKDDGRIQPMVTFRVDHTKIFNDIKEIVLSK